MADQNDDQERTLEPSQKRLDDARREGRVPRSCDLAHLAVLGGAAGGFAFLAASLFDSGRALMRAGLSFDAASLASPALMGERLVSLSGEALLAIAPLLALLMVAAVAAPLLVGGWVFSWEALAPKFSKLSPLAGFKRMFSLQALVQLAKVVLIAVLLGAVGFWYVASHIDEFASLAQQSLPVAVAHFGAMFLIAFSLLVGTLAAAALIDVPFQIHQHYSKLRMTLEEAKREQKESDGDPHVKARVRQIQREMARRRMMAAVPTADVVVTNPTHFAVAIKYTEGGRAPQVVAKGADEVAAKIRDLARESGVPRLEAPPLARALYRHVEIGQEIPVALYNAVAAVLAYVYQLKRFAAGQAPRPIEPTGLEVPPELDPAAKAEGVA